MSQSKQKNINTMMLIGILSSFTLANAQMLLSPALQQLSEEMGVSYSTMTYLSTVPSLVGIPMAMVAGWLIKRGMKYKTILLGSILLVIVGGVAPAFLDSFAAWMAARVLFALGFGCGIPVSGTITMASFHGDSLTRAQGLGSVVQNLTGVILPFIGGFVAAANVDMIWYLHLIYIIPFLLVLFFVKEPEDNADEGQPEAELSKEKVPSAVYLMSVAYGLIFMFIYPLILNMAGILIGENLGTASLAGTMTALFFAGGMISGAVFPKVYKKIGNSLIPLLCIGSGLGMFIAYIAHNVPLLMISNVLVGIFTMMIWPASLTRFGEFVPSGAFAMSASLFGFCINLFSFLASPYSSFVAGILGSNPRVHLFVGAIGCVIVGIIYFFFRNRIGRKEA